MRILSVLTLLATAATFGGAIEIIAPPAPRGGSVGSARASHRLEKLAGEEIIFSQVLHRHGARTPLPPANETLHCPNGGCGLLTNNGRHMLVKLGEMLKRRYAEQGYFAGDSYDPIAVYSQSTAIDRTMQSANGMLRGIFPKLDDFFPEIFSADTMTDNLLMSDSLPSLSLQNVHTTTQRYAALTPLRKELFPSDDIIIAMADELSIGGFCRANEINLCATKLYDIAACAEAEGKLDNYPLVKQNQRAVNRFYYAMFNGLFAYDPDSSLDQLRGSPGQPLAQEMIANMRQVAAGKMPYRFKHYSAHDTTLTPFAVTVGAFTEVFPEFGQAYILDLIKDNGALYVRAVKGAPEVVPGPHEYTVAPLQIGGIGSNGRKYYTNATLDRLPLEDFARFVDSSKPRSSLGHCYVLPEVSNRFGLMTVNAPPANAQTIKYRRNCPQYACPMGAKLNTDTLVCVQ